MSLAIIGSKFRMLVRVRKYNITGEQRDGSLHTFVTLIPRVRVDTFLVIGL